MIISGLQRHPMEHFSEEDITKKLMKDSSWKNPYGGSVYIHVLNCPDIPKSVSVGNFVSLSRKRDEDCWLIYFRPSKSGNEFISKHFNKTDNPAKGLEYVIPGGKFLLGIARNGRYSLKVECELPKKEE